MRAAYRFFVDRYATTVSANGTAQPDTYMGSFVYTVDPNGPLAPAPTQIFLPLIKR